VLELVLSSPPCQSKAPSDDPSSIGRTGAQENGCGALISVQHETPSIHNHWSLYDLLIGTEFAFSITLPATYPKIAVRLKQ
jgi:hypothetical protein